MKKKKDNIVYKIPWNCPSRTSYNLISESFYKNLKRLNKVSGLIREVVIYLSHFRNNELRVGKSIPHKEKVKFGRVTVAIITC